MSACAATVSDCPPWPKAGPNVADELSTLSLQNYPATWEWLGRLDKLERQLAKCRKE